VLIVKYYVLTVVHASISLDRSTFDTS